MADVKKFLDQAGVSTLWSKVAEEVAKVDLKANNNKTEIDTLKQKVSTLESAGYDDTELRGLVSANTTAIALLNNTAETEGSVSNTATKVAAAEVAKIVANAPESYDTLKEIADWISNDTTGAASMASDITRLEGLVGDTAVATQITTALDAALKVENVDKYALASELKALADRVKTLEDAEYQTAAQVQTAIAAYIGTLNLAATYEVKGAADQALIDAKSYTDTEVAKIQALSATEIEQAIAEAKASTETPTPTPTEPETEQPQA